MEMNKRILSYIESELKKVGFLSKSKFESGILRLEGESNKGDLKIGPIVFDKNISEDYYVRFIDISIAEIKKETNKSYVFDSIISFTSKYFKEKEMTSNSYIEDDNFYLKILDNNGKEVISEEFLCISHSLNPLKDLGSYFDSHDIFINN